MSRPTIRYTREDLFADIYGVIDGTVPMPYDNEDRVCDYIGPHGDLVEGALFIHFKRDTPQVEVRVWSETVDVSGARVPYAAPKLLKQFWCTPEEGVAIFFDPPIFEV